AWFSNAQFAQAQTLGPMLVCRQLKLDEIAFSAAIQIEASTPRLRCTATTFNGAASLRLRFSEVVLDRTLFSKPSTISFAESPLDIDETPLTMGNRPARPRLLSLRVVDVSNLVLGNLDLSACHFQGAHNLEKLRIEGPLRFGLTPSAWRVRLGR